MLCLTTGCASTQTLDRPSQVPVLALPQNTLQQEKVACQPLISLLGEHPQLIWETQSVREVLAVRTMEVLFGSRSNSKMTTRLQAQEEAEMFHAAFMPSSSKRRPTDIRDQQEEPEEVEVEDMHRFMISLKATIRLRLSHN